MNAMTPADRTAYIARRDAAVAAALAQIGTAAPVALADAGRHAQQAYDARQAALRSQGPSGVRKADLELAYAQGLAARAELDAIEAEEARAAEQERLAAEDAARVAAARAARLSSKVVDFVLRRRRR